MTITDWVQIVVLAALLNALTPRLGGYVASVYEGNAPR